jgi:hypothetical protein
MRSSMSGLSVRGLIDGVSMAWRLSELERRAGAALARLGLEGVRLPDCPFASYVKVPQHLAERALASFSPWFESMYDSRPETIQLQEAPVMGRWWYYLQPLDKKGKLSPVLWVKRDALRKTRRPRWLRQHQPIRLFLMDPTLEGEPEEGVWWCVGAMLEGNQWWQWDVERARRLIGRLSKVDIEHELSLGERIVRGDEGARAFWDGTWPMRPITYGPYEERPGQFPFPEYEAIPFYRVKDVKRAFATIMESYLCLSLLDDLTDKQLAAERTVAKARIRLGVPGGERRGRPRGRPRDLVDEVGNLVRIQGLSKYQVAKRLPLARSTVYDYLKEYDASAKESDN